VLNHVIRALGSAALALSRLGSTTQPPTLSYCCINHGPISVHNTLSGRCRSTNSQTPILQTLQPPSWPQAPPSHRESAPASENSPLVEIYRMGQTIWYVRVLGLHVRPRLSQPSIIGDIVYFNAAGRNVIVLNSSEVVHELLEKRSNIYSDRPILPLGGEIIGWGRGIVLAQHEAKHKTARKLIAQTMGKSQAKRFWGLQEWQTARFLQRLEENSDELIDHIRW